MSCRSSIHRSNWQHHCHRSQCNLHLIMVASLWSPPQSPPRPSPLILKNLLASLHHRMKPLQLRFSNSIFKPAPLVLMNDNIAHRPGLTLPSYPSLLDHRTCSPHNSLVQQPSLSRHLFVRISRKRPPKNQNLFSLCRLAEMRVHVRRTELEWEQKCSPGIFLPMTGEPLPNFLT